jgi:hypothetical protein
MFLAEKISTFMHGFKSAILAKLKNCQNGTFEPGHEIQKNFLTRSILLKHYGNGNKNFFSQLVPGSSKSRNYAGKSTKKGFSKKGLARINFFFLF